MGISRVLGEVILSQHKAKRALNRYIRNKSVTGWKGCYYTCIRDRLAVKYGVEIGVKTMIDGPVNFPHPRNIIIGDGVKIGKNFTVFNNVTIGQNHGRYPVIGDNVVIYPGSVIIGDIHIGSNVVIGANSLVNRDIEDNMVAAGNPARSIKRGMSE